MKVYQFTPHIQYLIWDRLYFSCDTVAVITVIIYEHAIVALQQLHYWMGSIYQCFPNCVQPVPPLVLNQLSEHPPFIIARWGSLRSLFVFGDVLLSLSALKRPPLTGYGRKWNMLCRINSDLLHLRLSVRHIRPQQTSSDSKVFVMKWPTRYNLFQTCPFCKPNPAL